MNNNKLLVMFLLLFGSLNLFSQLPDLPKIMYVNASSGLRMRDDPSLSSSVRVTIPYGERIVVTARSGTTVTIDRITDYWYKTFIRGYTGWVFGGYLSETLPSDVPVILGLWEAENNTGRVFYFNSNNIYREGHKESEWYRIGKWQLNENKLILITESGAYEELPEPEIKETYISVINRNTVVLLYSDGVQVRLIRSNDYDVLY